MIKKTNLEGIFSEIGASQRDQSLGTRKLRGIAIEL
jgi:hypothetical protein